MRRNETTRQIRRLHAEAQATPDLEERERLLLRCIDLDDGVDDELDRADATPVRMRSYFAYALGLLERGDVDAAVEVAKRTARRWPAKPDAHALVARIYSHQNAWVLAEAAYRRGLELAPCASLCILLASAIDKQGRHPERRALLEQALVIDPDYEEAHYNIGCNHRREGDRSAAVARFRRAVELDPDYALAHAALGEELFNDDPRANRAEAVAHLSRAVALDPADGWSHARLAIARDLDGRDDEARAHHEAAIRLLPDVGVVWSNYGAFLSSRDDAAAESVLRHGIEVDAEDGAPRASLALHLWRTDRRAEARMEMQAAHQLGHAKAMKWLDVWRSEPTD